MNLNYLKLVLLFLIYYITYFKDYYLKEIKIENEIIRFIKNKSKENVTKYLFEKNIPEIKKYINLLREGNFKNDIYNYNIYKPKISFIASVYNKEKYLKSFIYSIQNQNLKEFELVFVDDCSTDESVNIIREFKKKDKRIKLKINKKNMGSLYTRYKGAKYAKGEYFIFVDSDDIILKEGILNSYNYIKKNNLDMIEFNSVFEKNNTSIFISRRYYKYSDIIYQPILAYIYYYNYKEKKGIEHNTALWDKLIKRKIVLKSLKYIGKKFLEKNIIIENDVIFLFALFRNAKSFRYVDELGYYYFIENKDSITNTRFEPIKANQIIFSIFCNIEFLYDETESTEFAKYLCLYKLNQGYNRYRDCFFYLNKKTIKFVKQVLNKLLESQYISQNNKLLIKKISYRIIESNFY